MKKSKKYLKKGNDSHVPILALIGIGVMVLLVLVALISPDDQEIPDYMTTKDVGTENVYSIAEQPVQESKQEYIDPAQFLIDYMQTPFILTALILAVPITIVIFRSRR